ncbi:nucleotidyltransferase domain-containing protein [Methanocaldococcus indicus]|uniref:nucleotidyltransferase domain-containing protein n=1 Tax=Methanocaldococcus indicus TaxID=213231 RepID=UPI003C6CF4E2
MRIRDFIECEKGMFFAVNTYNHPKNKIYAFLRYVPKELATFNGIVRKINNKEYVKIPNSSEAYKFLKENFPEYLNYDKNLDTLMICVPKEKIKNVYYPHYRLLEIIEEPKNKLEEKCRKLAITLEDYGVNINSMGVTGSLLINLSSDSSDIDFVVYGNEFNKARNALKEAIEDNKIEALDYNFWKKAYEKRIKDNSLTLEEFIFHEKRKFNRGVIDNTMFDLLYVRYYKDIKEENKTYKKLGYIEIEGKVLDDKFIFDNPAIYKIECYNNKDIKEIAVFTHTYAGQCFKDEEFIARGILESVNNDEYKRLLIGSSREAINEYLKVKKLLTY